ncbi:MAG: SDR family oxidoreductase, partial [Pseudomonadota bacterium]
MVHMTTGLAREWARFDIAVNGIAPGYIRTELNDSFWETPDGQKLVSAFPKRRIGEPEDLDAALLLMADPAQRFITGQTLVVDDGQGLA